MKLNPHHPARFWSHLGKAWFVGRHYAQAIEAFMHLPTMDAQQHAFVAACYGWLGDRTAASAHVARIRELDPALDPPTLLATMHYANDTDVQHLREGLAKAGMPG
jgi:adenylate cyclase